MRAMLLLAAAAALACAACTGDDTQVGATSEAGADATIEASAGDAAGGSDAGAPGDADAEAGPTRVDRMARPAINTALVDRPLKNAYNAEDTYASTFPATYDDSFERHLEALDTLKLDGTNPDPVDWPVDAGPHALRDPLKLDVLLVDTGKTCVVNGAYAASYLDLENELLLGGPAHTTCGGRTPNEDVMDKTLTLLVTRGRAPVSDGVSAATKPATLTFPYLAGPN